MRYLAITPFLLASFSSLALAKVQTDAGYGNFTQSIQVVNLLANHNLDEVGMTPTPFIVQYYNGEKQPCWIATLNYQDDYTIHTGPTQGCRTKVDTIEFIPTFVAEKLKPYDTPITLKLDLTKYAHQITIIQNTSPTFSSSTGLVTQAGTLQAKVQAQ